MSQTTPTSPPDAAARPRWSVVVPAYNEADRIAPTLEAVEAFFARRGEAYELLVVDDGSTDRTIEVVAAAAPQARILRNPGNRGKGYSVRAGMREARGELVLFSDADLSTPIEEIERFEREFADGADVVIASRALKDSRIEVHQVWWRELSGRTFNLIVRLIAGLPYHDTQCGFKAYRSAAAKRIAAMQRLEGWAFDIEQLRIARLLSLEVREKPVRWINSDASKVSLLRDAPRMFLDALRVRFARYDNPPS